MGITMGITNEQISKLQDLHDKLSKEIYLNSLKLAPAKLTYCPLLICDTCKKSTQHKFIGKEHIYQNKLDGDRLMHQYACLVCGGKRFYGNEITPGKPPRIRRKNYSVRGKYKK
jgi:hypothetical protein